MQDEGHCQLSLKACTCPEFSFQEMFSGRLMMFSWPYLLHPVQTLPSVGQPVRVVSIEEVTLSQVPKLEHVMTDLPPAMYSNLSAATMEARNRLG